MQQTEEVSPRDYSECVDSVNKCYQVVMQEFQRCVQQVDPLVTKSDTSEAILSMLKQLHQAIDRVNALDENGKEQFYYLLFNGSVLLFKLSHALRKSVYSRQAVKYLALAALVLDNNIILAGIRFISWKVKVYVELARAYADFGALTAAKNSITYGIGKVLLIKEIQEQDPPVPQVTKQTLVEALRILRTMEIKFSLQKGELAPDAWRKKIEETFADNKLHKALAVVESLAPSDKRAARTLWRMKDQPAWMVGALKQAVDMMKNEIETLKKALAQRAQKVVRDQERETMAPLPEEAPSEENAEALQEYNELKEKYEKFDALDAELLPEPMVEEAKQNFPLDVQVSLLKLAYNLEQWGEFDSLLESAQVRQKYRRFETPFIASLDVIISKDPDTPAPDGFVKLPQDLNQADLRLELKKLRASRKKEEKKESGASPGRKESAVPGKKADQKKGAGKQAAAAAPSTEQEEKKGNVLGTEAQLSQIDHTYIYLCVQYTRDPSEAVVGVDIVMGDQAKGPKVEEKTHYAIPLPIRQHTGVFEKSGQIPFLIFRRTGTALQDEEDALSVITSIKPLPSKSPHVTAPLGFIKIATDLRQTPGDLERVPNLDYLYIVYKQDNQLPILQRDIQLLAHLSALQKSRLPLEEFLTKPPEGSMESYSRKFLHINYNPQLLGQLCYTLKRLCLGPLGDIYIQRKSDFLFDLIAQIWRVYIRPVKQRIEYYMEMKFRNELLLQDSLAIEEQCFRSRALFQQALAPLHRVLGKLVVQDMVFYNSISVYLSGLFEESGDFRNAVQILRAGIGKTTEWRENSMKRGVEASMNAKAPQYVTCNNEKIARAQREMMKRYETWRISVLRKEREKKRKEKGARVLDEDEADQEEYEYLRAEQELESKDLEEKEVADKAIITQVKKELGYLHADERSRYYSEMESSVVVLHADLFACLYRCEIKLGKQMNMIRNQTTKLMTQQGLTVTTRPNPTGATGSVKGLSKGMLNKATIDHGPTARKVRNDFKNLEHTLQQAGKLAPPKPQPMPFQNMLQQENNDNAYLNALLHSQMAASKSNLQEQKALLIQALEEIKRARSMEDALLKGMSENAIYVDANYLFNIYKRSSASDVYPQKLMGVSRYVKRTTVPIKPVLIARTSTTVTMKLPFFKPKTEFRNWKEVATMALFGKPAGAGVAVSLNNTEYEGLGVHVQPGSVVTITGLIPNESYVFAAAGYASDGACINGIGETCDPIVSLLPLSLTQLLGILLQTAYQLRHFSIAKSAAELLCSQFIEKNEHRNAYLETRINPALAFRLNVEAVQALSVSELQILSLAFVALAHCSKQIKSEAYKIGEMTAAKLEKQKIDLKIANYLLLALDLALATRQPFLTARILNQTYNHLVPIYNFRASGSGNFLAHATYKCQQAVALLPAACMDSITRSVCSSISFEAMRLSLQTHQQGLTQRVVLAELLSPAKRKWHRHVKYEERIPQLTEEQKEQRAQQQAKLEAGEEVEGEIIQEPQPIEERKVYLAQHEDEGRALQEFLLSLCVNNDVVKMIGEQWLKFMVQVQNAVTEGEKVSERVKAKVQGTTQFWEGIRTNIQLQLQNLNSGTTVPGAETGETSLNGGANASVYLEWVCKTVRRIVETRVEVGMEEIVKILEGVKVPVEEVQNQMERLTEAQDFLEKDVVWKSKRRFKLIEEKLDELEEQSSRRLDIRKVKQQINEITMSELRLQEAMMAKVAGNPLTMRLCLWYSELQILRASSQMAVVIGDGGLRKDEGATCYTELYHLDFVKLRQQIEDYEEEEQEARQQFQEDWKEKQEDQEEDKKEPMPEYQRDIPARAKQIAGVFESLALAAFFAKEAKAWIQLENVVRTCWNGIKFDLTNPLELRDTGAWKSISVIAECVLVLLEHLKKGGSLRNEYLVVEAKTGLPIQEVGRAKTAGEGGSFGGEGKTVRFADEVKGPESEGGIIATVEQLWFLGEVGSGLEELDIQILANFIGFTTQALLAVQKWETLIEVNRRFNTATNNYFAGYLLPFVIHAQKTLYEGGSEHSAAKRVELGELDNRFETWKNTHKKKMARQLRITGEIPPEELEFERQRAELKRELFRRETVEAILKDDKEESEQILENIKRDSNTAYESLKQCRRLLAKYPLETRQLQEEEAKKGAESYEVKAKRKAHKVFTSMIFSNFKKTVELLRKRQDNRVLIQALHELGNLYYADGQLKEAQINWSDALDTVFQQLYVLNSFRTSVLSHSNIAAKFGHKQCLVAGVLLSKLAKLCYSHNLAKREDALLLASECLFAPLKLSLPHPQQYVHFALYRMQEYLPTSAFAVREGEIFSDQNELSPHSLLSALETISEMLIDYEMYERALPLLTIMEYVAADEVHSAVLVAKARTLKALALGELGYINEAFQIMFARVLNPQYDGVVNGAESMRATEFRQKELGVNSGLANLSKMEYHNDLPPDHQNNKEAIQRLQSVDILEQIKKFKMIQRKAMSPYVMALLAYTRCVLMFRVAQAQNVKLYTAAQGDSATLRANLLGRVQGELRGLLELVSVSDQISFLQQRQNRVGEQKRPFFEQAMKRLIEKSQLTVELVDPFYKQAGSLEEERSYSELREQSMNLLCRSRMLLTRCYKSQSLLLHAVLTVQKGLRNFGEYSQGGRQVETADDQEYKKGLALGTGDARAVPEPYGFILPGKNVSRPPSNAPGGKKAPAKEEKKKAPAKAAPSQKNVVAAGGEEGEEPDEMEKEFKRVEAQENEMWRGYLGRSERTPGACGFYWMKMKAELVGLLVEQKRFHEAKSQIKCAQEEAKSLQDVYFVRLLLEADLWMDLLEGRHSNLLTKVRAIKEYAKKHHHNGWRLASFYGNAGELLLTHQGKDCVEQALSLLKEARIMMWYKIRDYGIELEPTDFNKNAGQLHLDADVKQPPAVKPPSAAPPAAGGGAAKAPAKAPAKPEKGGAKQAKAQDPKDAAAAAQPQKLGVYQDLPHYPPDTPDLSTIASQSELFINGSADLNSSLSKPNSYIRNLELVLELDVIYGLALTRYNTHYEAANRVLEGTSRFIDQMLYPSVSLCFQSRAIKAHLLKELFLEKLREFQIVYVMEKGFKEKVKKYKRLPEMVPNEGGLLSGYQMQRLPNFSKMMCRQWQPLLLEAKKAAQEALSVLQSESILVVGFGLSAQEVTLLLAQICFLLSEYRPRIRYRYLDFQGMDNERKAQNERIKNEGKEQAKEEEEDAKQEAAAPDNWEKRINTSQQVEVYNLRRQAVSMLRLAIETQRLESSILDRYPVLAATNFTGDATKLPKEFLLNLFETNMLAKRNYSDYPNLDALPKATISTSDILSLITSLFRDVMLKTIGSGGMLRQIAKVHRFLEAGLPPYKEQCCFKYKEYEKTEDVEAPLLQNGEIVAFWHQIVPKVPSAVFYCLGAGEAPPPPAKEQGEAAPAAGSSTVSPAPVAVSPEVPAVDKNYEMEVKDAKEVLFGWAHMETASLGKMFQEFLDLRRDIKISGELSEQRKERDNGLQLVRFRDILKELAYIFRAPDKLEQDEAGPAIVPGEVPIYEFTKGLREEDVDTVIAVVSIEGVQAVNPSANGFVRRLHRLRYKK